MSPLPGGPAPEGFIHRAYSPNAGPGDFFTEALIFLGRLGDFSVIARLPAVAPAEDFLYLFRFVAESNQQSSPLGRIETVNPAAKLLNHGLPGRFGFAFFSLPDGLKVMMRIQELQQAAP